MIATKKINILTSRFATALLLGLFTILYGMSYGQSVDKNNFERVITIPTDDPFPESSFLTIKKAQGKFALVEQGIPAGGPFEGRGRRIVATAAARGWRRRGRHGGLRHIAGRCTGRRLRAIAAAAGSEQSEGTAGSNSQQRTQTNHQYSREDVPEVYERGRFGGRKRGKRASKPRVGRRVVGYRLSAVGWPAIGYRLSALRARALLGDYARGGERIDRAVIRDRYRDREGASGRRTSSTPRGRAPSTPPP